MNSETTNAAAKQVPSWQISPGRQSTESHGPGQASALSAGTHVPVSVQIMFSPVSVQVGSAGSHRRQFSPQIFPSHGS